MSHKFFETRSGCILFINSQAKHWSPIPRLFPIHSFPTRLSLKCMSVMKNSKSLLGLKLRLSGARLVGETAAGNSLLRLNRTSELGVKGFIIAQPRDGTIFKHIQTYGYWEKEESKFISKGLIEICSSAGTKVALLDIGANTGLITLQAMNLSNTNNEVHLFEPIPKHIEALNHNLKVLIKNNTAKIYEFGLSNEDAQKKIYTRLSNQGKSTLLPKLLPPGGRKSTTVKVRDTNNFFKNRFADIDKFVIKCDIEGFDALVLAMSPKAIWDRVDLLVVEVWPVESIREKDVSKLIQYLQDFTVLSWSTNPSVAISLFEVREYWLNKSAESRNLFAKKYNLH